MSRSRVRRKLLWLGCGSLFVAGLGVSTALAVHHVPEAGPLLANTLRKIVGVEAVAKLEELAADAEDRVMRARFEHEPPRSLRAASNKGIQLGAAPPAPVARSASDPRSDTRSASDSAPNASYATDASEMASAEAPKASFSESESVRAAPRPTEPPFVLANVAPPHPAVAAEGDGEWVPVLDPARPDAPALLHTTLIHPDPERRYAELFVVAMPRDRILLRPVPGTAEPATTNPAAAKLTSRGLIPASMHEELLAAFNGGFRAEHGHYGMAVDGVVLLPARTEMCTVAGYADGSLRIGTHARLAAVPEAPSWFRQTPRCMVEDGELNPRLANPNTKNWGATLDGDTVIRRSAIALSEDGKVLYVGVSNYTTARALALGMRAVGGFDVAQLDVNKSFPKFLLFPRTDSGERRAVSLFDGFLFTPEEMIDKPAERDFFYVLRRPSEERAAAPSIDLDEHPG